MCISRGHESIEGQTPRCAWSLSGLDPNAMDRCDCDSAGKVDDTRGSSHLLEEMTLNANKP